nr:MAG TPA: hypothetical protein [Caudoviricetes sp.]
MNPLSFLCLKSLHRNPHPLFLFGARKRLMCWQRWYGERPWVYRLIRKRPLVCGVRSTVSIRDMVQSLR